MLKDPIEETEEFKAIVDEAERKTCLYFVELEIGSLEDIVNKGFTYDKDGAFGLYQVGKLRSPEPILPSPEEAKEKEEKAEKYLKIIKDLLEKDDVSEAYWVCCRINSSFYAHRFFGRKKYILKSEYGIDWKTPEEMNPWVLL